MSWKVSSPYWMITRRKPWCRPGRRRHWLREIDSPLSPKSDPVKNPRSHVFETVCISKNPPMEWDEIPQ
jgi:hypothetical protein